MLLQFKVIRNGTRLVVHTTHRIEARLFSRIFSRFTKSSICRISTFINARMYHLPCRIDGYGHNHTTFFLYIVDRSWQTARTQRTTVQR